MEDKNNNPLRKGCLYAIAFPVIIAIIIGLCTISNEVHERNGAFGGFVMVTLAFYLIYAFLKEINIISKERNPKIRKLSKKAYKILFALILNIIILILMAIFWDSISYILGVIFWILLCIGIGLFIYMMIESEL